MWKHFSDTDISWMNTFFLMNNILRIDIGHQPFLSTQHFKKLPPFICYLVAKSCLTCDPIDCNPPGSSVHEIFQARILSGLPFPSPVDLPYPGIEPASPA